MGVAVIPAPEIPITWAADASEKNYQDAENFLSLLLDADDAEDLVKELQKAVITTRRANDILRACNRVPLPLNDPGVIREFTNVANGISLPPILVVSWKKIGAEIVDGYHRTSLVYALDPYCEIPCRIAYQ